MRHRTISGQSWIEEVSSYCLLLTRNQNMETESIMEEEKTQRKVGQNLILKVVLDGLYDEESPLSNLRGLHHILKYIWTDVRNYWKSHITLPDPDAFWNDSNYLRRTDNSSPLESSSCVYMAPMSHIDNHNYEDSCYPKFPTPSGININMMPFICGDTFDNCKLPDFLRPYYGLIELCLQHQSYRENHHMWPKEYFSSDLGKVYFLTIQESEVDPGQSQRRPGLHVDSPGWVNIKNVEDMKPGQKGSGSSHLYTDHRWGAGFCHVFNLDTQTDKDIWDIFEENLYVTFGGIYIASNVPDSTMVWNCAVDGEVIGQHGDIEHLRSALGEGEVMRPGQVYWITDRTPHESLPLKEKTMRQFFRIVTSEVSFWFRDHSTPNPLGVMPDPEVTQIVSGDKFAEDGVNIVKADVTKEMLRGKIQNILKGADLDKTSCKKVRQQLEEKLGVDLNDRKKEVEELVMEVIDT